MSGTSLMVRCVAGLVTLAPFPAVLLAWEQGDEKSCPAEGVYNNPFGFLVEIPAGAKGCPDSPVGMSDHGVAFSLGPSRATIDVFASYNALDLDNADAAADQQLENLQGDARNKEIRVRSRSSISLDGLEAVRIIIDFEREGMPIVTDVTVAVRGVRSTPDGVSYAISLTTSAQAYPADKEVIDAVLNSWRATPISSM